MTFAKFRCASCRVLTTLDVCESTLVCSFLFNEFIDDIVRQVGNVRLENERLRLFFLSFVSYHLAAQIFTCTRCYERACVFLLQQLL